MVVIEQELDPQEIQSNEEHATKSRSKGGGGSEDESFEDALTEDQLNEVQFLSFIY